MPDGHLHTSFVLLADEVISLLLALSRADSTRSVGQHRSDPFVSSSVPPRRRTKLGHPSILRAETHTIVLTLSTSNMSSSSTSLASLHPTISVLPPRTPQPSPPSHHVPTTYWFPTQTYKNPWPSHRSPVNYSTLVNTFFDPGQAPHPDDADPDEGVHPVEEHAETDWSVGEGKVKGMWMGHASFYMGFPRANGGGEVGVLFDPVFEERCSPSSWVGPIRDIKTPCLIPDLPVSDPHCYKAVTFCAGR